MSWVKQSDKLWSDPKFTRLTDGAQALRTRADSYIADHLLDGIIPDSALKLLGARTRYVQELERTGYWVRVEPGSALAPDWLESGSWLASDWPERIRSKAEVLAKRNETLQRVRRFRNGVTNAACNASPDPGPLKIPEEEARPRAAAAPKLVPPTPIRRTRAPVPSEVPAWVAEQDAEAEAEAKFERDRRFDLPTFVHTTYARLFQARFPRAIASVRMTPACAQIAEWAEAAGAVNGTDARTMVVRLIEGLFASTSQRTVTAKYPLGYAAQNPNEYILANVEPPDHRKVWTPDMPRFAPSGAL